MHQAFSALSDRLTRGDVKNKGDKVDLTKSFFDPASLLPGTLLWSNIKIRVYKWNLIKFKVTIHVSNRMAVYTKFF